MQIKAKIFSSNWETYKKIYKDAIKRAYTKDNIDISTNNIKVELDYIEGNTIQAQRAPSSRHSRTISVYEDKELKYIIGLSNTGYDEDKKKEVEEKGGKYVYGNDNWHSNTYLCQGINKIFEYYYDSKKEFPNVKLYFYLLDVDEKAYPNNLSNSINYRKLATIGFEILNIDKINFTCLENLGFSVRENYNNIAYISFNKFANDILRISKRNSGNVPSYLKCVNLSYDINSEVDDETEITTNHNMEKYIYTFKTLGAESYDCFLTMWTLQVLAERENKNLEFLFSSEMHNFRFNQDNVRMTMDFPTSITTLFEKIGLDIKYENSTEILQQLEREKNQYETAKKNNVLRNQELFKNNMRAKGLATKCHLCDCEIESILEAAHLWGVAEIKRASKKLINNTINLECMKELVDENNPHKDEDFYKRYVMANSGDNGIWLCSNHHGLFDSHYYCFDSKDGKILFDINSSEETKEFFKTMTKTDGIPQDVLTERTKVFLANNRVK